MAFTASDAAKLVDGLASRALDDGDQDGAAALANAAKLVRARADQETTDRIALRRCYNCGAEQPA